MHSFSQNDINDGAKVYTKKSLKIYDLIVLKISNQFIWRCPTRLILKQLKKSISNDHLDIGTGTGYYLKKLITERNFEKLSILDLYENCLELTSKRIYPQKHKSIKHNIYEPIPESIECFKSISAIYLFHCLPGTADDKSTVIKNIADKLKDNGTFFGAQIISDEYNHNFLSKKLMNFYNKKKFFCNYDDKQNDLRKNLEKHFKEVDFKIKGCVALFTCKK